MNIDLFGLAGNIGTTSIAVNLAHSLAEDARSGMGQPVLLRPYTKHKERDMFAVGGWPSSLDEAVDGYLQLDSAAHLKSTENMDFVITDYNHGSYHLFRDLGPLQSSCKIGVVDAAYVSLARIVERDVHFWLDHLIVVTRIAGTPLTTQDVFNVLGVPIMAEYTLSASVQRTIDAGLLTTKTLDYVSVIKDSIKEIMWKEANNVGSID